MRHFDEKLRAKNPLQKFRHLQSAAINVNLKLFPLLILPSLRRRRADRVIESPASRDSERIQLETTAPFIVTR
jgi:hypothetical protein